MTAVIQPGTYVLENVASDGIAPRRVLDLKGSSPAPQTELIAWANATTDNQMWQVTRFNDGYNFQAVAPSSNAFVRSIAPGETVTGTPLQRSAFKLRDAGGQNKYQIILEESGNTYAWQAPQNAADPIVLRALVASNPHQVWRFVNVN